MAVLAGLCVLAVQWDGYAKETGKKPIFARMDVDGNGTVTSDEFTARMKAFFGEMDADGDGKVTSGEYLAGAFERWNADTDDTIERDEFIAYFVGPENKDKKSGKMSAGPKDTEFKKVDADGDGVVTIGEMVVEREAEFNAMDADGDGKVIRKEYDAYREKRLKELDLNNDGVLSVEEFQMTPKK